MGEDLLLNWVWADRNREIDWEAIGAAIDALPDKRVYSLGGYGSDDDWEHRAPAVSEKQLADELQGEREALKLKLAGLKSVWNGEVDGRKTYWTYIGPLKVAITGGSTWGDSPTEDFDAWNDLAEAGVLEAGGFCQFGNEAGKRPAS